MNAQIKIKILNFKQKQSILDILHLRASSIFALATTERLKILWVVEISKMKRERVKKREREASCSCIVDHIQKGFQKWKVSTASIVVDIKVKTFSVVITADTSVSFVLWCNLKVFFSKIQTTKLLSIFKKMWMLTTISHLASLIVNFWMIQLNKTIKFA